MSPMILQALESIVVQLLFCYVVNWLPLKIQGFGVTH